MGICSCYKWGFQRLTLMARLWRLDTNHGRTLQIFVKVAKYSKGHKCNSNTHIVPKSFVFVGEFYSFKSNTYELVIVSNY